MKKIIFITLILIANLSFGQDGRSLLLVHNYADKTAIDGITNPTEGNIAYNATDKSIYVYNGSKWIVDAYAKLATAATGPLNLNEDYYTVIVENATHNVTLPAAADYIGREYIIKNTTATDLTISDYNDNTNTTATTIPAEKVLKVQSDGSIWHQVNNFASGNTSSSNCTEESSNLTPSNLFNVTNYDDQGNGKEIYFEYGNGSSPDITELHILIVDVPYSSFLITDAEIVIPGPNNDIDLTVEPGVNLSINSGTSCNTNTLYSHVITISGQTISDGHVIEIDFSANVDGNDGGGGNTTDCTGCIIEFYTN